MIYRYLDFTKIVIPYGAGVSDSSLHSSLYKCNVESDSLASAVSRARARFRDICYCNRFTHFFTLTFDPLKFPDVKDRMSLVKSFVDFMQFKRVQFPELFYCFVTEFHQSGAVHLHGFLNIPRGSLRLYRSKWRKGSKTGFSWFSKVLLDKFGLNTLSPLKSNFRASVHYCLKYINKQSYAGLQRGEHRYFFSRNLKTAPDKIDCQLSEQLLKTVKCRCRFTEFYKIYTLDNSEFDWLLNNLDFASGIVSSEPCLLLPPAVQYSFA